MACNGTRSECISASKIYDWVVNPSQQTCCVRPTGEDLECLRSLCQTEGILEVEVTRLEEDTIFPAVCEAPRTNCGSRILNLKRTTIDIDCEPVEVAIVCVAYEVPLKITISKKGSCSTSDQVCCFTTTCCLHDNVVLSLPEPLGKNNISTNVIEVDATCSEIFCPGDGSLPVLDIGLFVCLEILVQACVKLEVQGRHCQPRGPIPLPEIQKKKCPPCVRFPKSSGALFPRPMCDCSAKLCAELEDVDATYLDVVHVGDLKLNGEFCVEGSTECSYFDAKFVSEAAPYYTCPDERVNFCFTANTFGIVCDTCVPGTIDTTSNRITISGSGTLTSRGAGAQTVNYTLVLEDQGRQGGKWICLTLSNGVTPLFELDCELLRNEGKLIIESC